MHFPPSVAAQRQAAAFSGDPNALASTMTRLGLPLFVLFVFRLGSFQVTLLDRLVVTTGDEGEPASTGA